MVDEVRFAPMTNGREIAYRVVSDGDGPVIVHTPVEPFPLDLLAEDPMYDRFLRTLGGCGRLVVYDRPGVGSSDPLDPSADFHDQMTAAYVAVPKQIGGELQMII